MLDGATSADSLHDTSRVLDMLLDKVRSFGGRIEELSPTSIGAVFGLDIMEEASRRAAHAARAMRRLLERGRHGEGAGVGLLPEGLQAKLLEAIEERAVRRLGGTRSEPVDAWILSATNAVLAVANRRSRNEAAAVTITVPASPALTSVQWAPVRQIGWRASMRRQGSAIHMIGGARQGREDLTDRVGILHRADQAQRGRADNA